MPGTGDDWYSKSELRLSREPFWDRAAVYQTIGERFNDEMGFVPRTRRRQRRAATSARTSGRSGMAAGWLRETFPHFQIENFTARSGGGLESRYMDWHWPVTFQNSTFIEVGVNPNVEVIDDAVHDQQPPQHQRRCPAATSSTSTSCSPTPTPPRRSRSTCATPSATSTTATAAATRSATTVRANEHFNVSGNVQFNDIELPQGAFTTHLVTGRVNYYFNTKVFVNALVQYNTDTRQWSSNVRLNIIHRPLSDIFLVYNERHDSRSGDVLDRALIAKMTYLIAF